MSLTEMHLAPAVIASAVRNRGHNFEYIDANLELWQCCRGNSDQYHSSIGFLQNLQNYNIQHDLIDTWMSGIVDRVAGADIVLINVFSVLSQGAARRIIDVVKKHSSATILVGGIGSHKKIFGAVNQFNLDWIKNEFPVADDLQFGALLLNNGLVDDWQTDVGLDVLEKHLPQRISKTQTLVDFQDYKIDEYQWEWNRKQIPMLGSHGCVRQCSFCDVVVHFKKYDYVEADYLTQQLIDVYNQTNVSTVQFVDSLVNGSMSNFLALLKNLSTSKDQALLPADFAWSGTYICRPHSKQLDQIHEYLGSSGAENLIIGVETGSDRIRFEMDKKFTNADLLAELSAFNLQGVKTQLLFFPSWPTETLADFDDTLTLFSDLSNWAHVGTVDSVSLGNSGFVLLDNTPVDNNRDQIGLEPGPTAFLWHCAQNPNLDFWESMRRRMVMHYYAIALGIPLAREADFLRYLKYTIQTDLAAIVDYTGRVSVDFISNQLPDKLVSTVCENKIKMSVINSGSAPVTLTLTINQQLHTKQILYPGPNSLTWDLDHYHSQTTIKFDFVFDDVYQPLWDRYNSGDYYARNGLYVNEFYVDGRDITLSAFNNIVVADLDIDVPQDFSDHQNQRVIPGPGQLTLQIPQHMSFQEYVLRSINPAGFREMDHLISEIQDYCSKF